MKPSIQTSPKPTAGEVIGAIERILDRYWRDALKDYVTADRNPGSPHPFVDLQVLDRLRLELQNRPGRSRHR